MRFHGYLSGQLTRAEYLEARAQLFDRTELEQTPWIESIPFELFQAADVDNRVLFSKYISEPALGQAAVQRHLTAFKASHDAIARDRSGTLGSAARIFAATTAHALPDALLLVLLSGGRFEFTEVHISPSRLRADAEFSRPYPETPAYPVERLRGSWSSTPAIAR